METEVGKSHRRSAGGSECFGKLRQPTTPSFLREFPHRSSPGTYRVDLDALRQQDP